VSGAFGDGSEPGGEGDGARGRGERRAKRRDERVIFSRRIFFPQRFIIHLMRAVAVWDERDES
jgi:hypothetical protein